MTATAAEASPEEEQNRPPRGNHIETPQNVSVTNISWDRATINWDAPTGSNVTHYRIKQTAGGAVDAADRALPISNFTSEQLLRMTPAVNYTFEVSFGTSLNDFGPVVEASFRTLQMPNVTGLQFDVVEHDTILVVWDDPATTDGFSMNIQYTRQGDFDYVVTNFETIPPNFTIIGDLGAAGEGYTVQAQFKYEDANGTFTTQPSEWTTQTTIIPSAPVLNISPASGDEGETLEFVVRMNKASTMTTSVDYRTTIESDDTAESNDIMSVNSTLEFTAGVTELTIEVETAASIGFYEDDETFTVEIRNPDRATLGTAKVKGTILETDGLPQMYFYNRGLTIGEAIQSSQFIPISISPISVEKGLPFSLQFSGSATNGDDYTDIEDSFTMTPGQSGYNITLHLVDDNLYEGTETSVLRLISDSPHATVRPNEGTFTLTITDNDTKPTLVATAHQTGTEGGQNQGTEPVPGQDFANVVFKLHLQGRYGTDISVNVEAIDGTAVEGDDYELDINQVTFTRSQAIHYIKIPVIDNAEFGGGGAKSFKLKLTAASHGIPPNSVYLTGIIKDNEEAPEGGDYVSQDVNTGIQIAVGDSWINGNPIKGRIEHLYDQDWYSTELQKNHCYQIDIWGKEMYEHFKDDPAFHVDELTLVDPALTGIHREDGVYLPGSRNYDGWLASTVRHTISVSRTGTYFLAAGHDRWEGGGTFEISLFDMGGVNQHCTKLDVDNLTYEPGYFAGK